MTIYWVSSTISINILNAILLNVYSGLYKNLNSIFSLSDIDRNSWTQGLAEGFEPILCIYKNMVHLLLTLSMLRGIIWTGTGCQGSLLFKYCDFRRG